MDDLQAFLNSAATDATILAPEPPLLTAQAAAEALGVPLESIFKSILLTDGSGKFVVAVLPGVRRVDTSALAKIVGVSKLRLADRDTVLAQTGYPAGGTPPVGHRHPIPVVLDESLMRYEVGFGGGGREELILKIRPQEIARLTNATVAAIGQ